MLIMFAMIHISSYISTKCIPHKRPLDPIFFAPRPPPEPLAFRVIPSTESMAEAALEAAWMAPEEQAPGPHQGGDGVVSWDDVKLKYAAIL